MGTVVLLTIASATGMAVAVGVLRGRHAMGVMAAQGFVVVAVSLILLLASIDIKLKWYS